METLGINPSLLLGQIVNFLILFIVLKKLVYKPLMAGIEKRKQKLKEAQAVSVGIEKTLAQAEAKKQDKLNEVKKEASLILANAKKEADNEREKILSKAKKDALSIVTKAKTELAKERKQTEKEMKQKSIDLGVKIAGKLISSYLKPVNQKQLISKAINTVNKIQ